jgi:hypothetical protein
MIGEQLLVTSILTRRNHSLSHYPQGRKRASLLRLIGSLAARAAAVGGLRATLPEVSLARGAVKVVWDQRLRQAVNE